jgi:hypothetical protein
MPVSQGPQREERVRAAVDELAASQDQLFDELERGFDDRRDLVLWLHKASARTLGRIPDEWPQQLLGSRYQTSGLLGVEDGTHAPDEALADFERDLVRDDILLEACQSSMRFISQRSTQYADGSSGGESKHNREFGPQRWLAMRPSLDELVTRQRNALKRVLGRDDQYPNGLEGHEDISRWVRSVQRASRGLDGGLSRDAIWSPWWRQTLTDDPRQPDLHLLLADEVLSVFNAAIREEASQADEAPDEETQQQTAFQT